MAKIWVIPDVRDGDVRYTGCERAKSGLARPPSGGGGDPRRQYPNIGELKE
jgi:hypothetical protein